MEARGEVGERDGWIVWSGLREGGEEDVEGGGEVFTGGRGVGGGEGFWGVGGKGGRDCNGVVCGAGGYGLRAEGEGEGGDGGVWRREGGEDAIGGVVVGGEYE